MFELENALDEYSSPSAHRARASPRTAEALRRRDLEDYLAFLDGEGVKASATSTAKVAAFERSLA